MGIDNFITFLMATIIFVVTPGIDTLFVLNKSMSLGKKSGLYGAMGVSTGVLMHTLFAAFGLSVMLANSANAFIIVKYLGALYLIYLGVMKIKNKNKVEFSQDDVKSKTPKNDYWSGFLTNLLNPKVALFFLAFFPQFVQSSQTNNPMPFVVLGLTYAFLGTLWSLCIILFSSVFSKKMKENNKFSSVIDKVSGCVFIGMGIKIAMTK